MTDSNENNCPFCKIPVERIIASNEYAVAICDAFPVSQGHTLIVARRHTPNFFDLSRDEMKGAMDLVDVVRARLEFTIGPHGYNIGVNIGDAAGQTVMHVHIHIIPRFRGDCVDPTGGVRNVIPGKGRYHGQ